MSRVLERDMNIHEYQGKELLRNSGVPVLDGIHCTSVEQALAAYDKLDSKVVAVKSQIHAGGRGKGTLYHPETHEHIMDGGVKIAFSREEVEKYSKNILGNLLVTIQTGDDGKIVNNLYIESGCDIAHEYYLALLVDREKKILSVVKSLTAVSNGIEDSECDNQAKQNNPSLLHTLSTSSLSRENQMKGLPRASSGTKLAEKMASSSSQSQKISFRQT